MSQFYARYIPPPSKSIASKETAAATENRKRKAESEARPKKKKQRLIVDSDETQKDEVASRKSQRTADSKQIQPNPDTKDTEEPTSDMNGDKLISKYKVSATAARKQNEIEVRQRVAGVNSSSHNSSDGINGTESKSEAKKTKKRRNNIDDLQENQEVIRDADSQQKHAGVLSKFNKAKATKQPNADDERPVQKDETAEIHGLEPIPQPEASPPTLEKPSYSTLASWQSNAVKVVHGSAKKFSDFSISEVIASNLKNHGLKASLPVQTTVLPLLLEGPDYHDGDVCVSAATGSGKTLAYVVPIVEALRQYQATRLRGVIVVPTRELVQQVRKLCEVCAAGTSLKIATAAGSKSIKEEQKVLVTQDEIYDPQEWEKQQKASIDWNTFSLEKLTREAQTKNVLDSVHFVKRFRSNVDILITTPGRLVDHLKSTDGFTLDDVSWLVVDEADRLLNESYQEWIDTVSPALRSQAATKTRDDILRYMRMDVPKRVVKKLLLSATMTRDISKLNSLVLENPKLVVLGGAQLERGPETGSQANGIVDDPQPGQEGDFHLPSSLSEFAVPIKDGYEKPLYLLQLLHSRILAESKESALPKKASNSSSSNSSTSDESDSSESSDTDSDADGSSASPSTSASSKLNNFIAKSSTPQTNQSSSQQSKVLIFTRSTSSATRLSRLLRLLSPDLTLSTLTRSTSSSSTSRRALKAFLTGKTSILIATDRASRGLDIPHLTHVISYDVPASALTYVHRVGRTARAGREGSAWTIIEHREGKWFWEEIGGKTKAGGEQKIVRGAGKKVKRVEVVLEGEWEGEQGKKKYEDALGKLGAEVRGNT